MNANEALDAVQRLVAENCELKQDLQDIRERYEAVIALLSPPALIPVADVPVRDVTHIAMDDDPA